MRIQDDNVGASKNGPFRVPTREITLARSQKREETRGWIRKRTRLTCNPRRGDVWRNRRCPSLWSCGGRPSPPKPCASTSALTQPHDLSFCDGSDAALPFWPGRRWGEERRGVLLDTANGIAGPVPSTLVPKIKARGPRNGCALWALRSVKCFG